MKSMEEMIKAAQDAAQNIQKQMEEAQGKLDQIEVEGQSGGGLVKVRASAKGRIIGLSIDDSLIVPSDKQMLEDLIIAAFNDAREKADLASNEEMGKMTSGLPLPAGFKMPF
ncbi:MAG: YbaB/EbfC family nucleoid-associated protein [Sphingomonadales bacterium]|nr:YbaB/EbfC family nucleoid-associated protein [Sphingomonadales bacterium]